ncbi:GAF domain-containing sensor histidine kinase [Deminuibacter soli]|uniref:histidine kinase n=1 Tax=Deminuibacter soli TaxID=2291815 RepID=A0A3E1NGB3_9BACT|nr:ATP-binding protein [Deminuibacter soli]RFM26927.1 histidine kinase [Deminuibacter soli]
MSDTLEAQLAADIEAVQHLSIVPTMLEVICLTTGMGFAAVARVTQQRWIACCVRDEISFGLKPGGELQLQTTICNEIRDSGKAVIIDHVSESDLYRYHHTPAMYGFQSYISFPLFLKNGAFFGTLCAIDPRPAQLNNPKIIGLFTLFAELLMLHLHSTDILERSQHALFETNRQLTHYRDENRQYQHISNHSLQEPLRKIRMFSDLLVNATEETDVSKARNIASKINSFAGDLSRKIHALTTFSELDEQHFSFEPVDLNLVIREVRNRLAVQLNEKQAALQADVLPEVKAVPAQMVQLFYHLVRNAVQCSRSNVKPLVHIYARPLNTEQQDDALLPGTDLSRYCEIVVADNGTGIEQAQLGKIFDIFVRFSNDSNTDGSGSGLAYCRKIVRNHGGSINVTSNPGEGSVFSLLLPLA